MTSLLATILGQASPNQMGWRTALVAIPAVLTADVLQKGCRKASRALDALSVADVDEVMTKSSDDWEQQRLGIVLSTNLQLRSTKYHRDLGAGETTKRP